MSLFDIISGVASSLGFASIAIFFLQRYISKTDDSIAHVLNKIESAHERLTRLDERIAEYNFLINTKLQEFDSRTIDIRETILEKLEQIKQENRDMKKFYSTENEMLHNKYGRVIHDILGKQEQRISDLTNKLKNK